MRVIRMAPAAALLLVGSVCAYAAEQQTDQPTEQQLLDALKARGPTRCPHAAPSGCKQVVPGQPVGPSAVGNPGVSIEIPFGYASAIPSPAAKAALAALADALGRRELKGTALLIAGHTDGKGGGGYNQRLSERRAEAVKRILVADFKVPADTLTAAGRGKREPKNIADPRAAENRRVEIGSAKDAR